MLPHCCCRYTNIYVGRPSLEEDYIQASAVTGLVAVCFSHWREAGMDTSAQADAALPALARAHPNLVPTLQTELTPNQCRLRDQTYSAPITVDVEYTRWVLVCCGKFCLPLH